MSLDEVLAHVIGVRGRVANAADPGDGRGGADQSGEPDRLASAVHPMIGVDVLAEQGDLSHPGAGEARDLVENGGGGARGLGSAGIRHDAERAELVAALLHSHEGGDAATTNRIRRPGRKPREFVLRRKFSVHDARADARLAQELRQAMVALRADDNVDRGLAAQDLRSLGLSDAARDDQHRPAAGALAFLLELAQLAELGIDLLRGAFADMAGVEDDEVGVFDARGLVVPRLGGEIAHSLGIIDVHLASERLDERPWVRFPCGTCNPIRVFKHNRFGQLGAPEGPTHNVGAFAPQGNSQQSRTARFRAESQFMR